MKVVIVGAGLSGLYAALVWTVRNRHAEIEIFEASDRVGGRIYTVRKDSYQFEGGAGRIGPADAQPLLWKLMKYLDLIKDVRPMSERTDVSALVRSFGLPNGDERRQAQIQFGYDAEFEELDRSVAPAYIRRHFRGPFYFLENGLDQISNRMYERLRANPNVQIHLKTPVKNITSTHVDGRPYDVLFVCAERLDKITFTGVEVPREVQFAKPIELMRIFVHVESDQFDPFTKRTGPGPIRMWIPMGPHLAQIYTDSHWAAWWKQQSDAKVVEQVRNFLNDEDASVRVIDREFWKRGVHVWTQPVRSSQVPFGRVWFAGELFATESFGWMEGALETVRAYFTD